MLPEPIGQFLGKGGFAVPGAMGAFCGMGVVKAHANLTSLIPNGFSSARSAGNFGRASKEKTGLGTRNFKTRWPRFVRIVLSSVPTSKAGPSTRWTMAVIAKCCETSDPGVAASSPHCRRNLSTAASSDALGCTS